MKHWCFYTRVVTYLEKVEALFPDKTHKGAYLLWRDDDGNPLMIAGPGVDWFQGRGPMPDLNNLGRAVGPPAANPRTATSEAWTEVHARVGTRAGAPRQQAPAKSKWPNATKQQSHGRKPVQPISGKQPCKHRQPKQQSAASKPAVKTPTHRPSAASKTAQAAQQPRSPTKQANKKRTKFVKPTQTRSNPLKSAQIPPQIVRSAQFAMGC